MAGKKILGEGGQIPRLVKGLLIARDVRFEAKLDSARIEEIKKSSGGRGGFRLGPVRIGGGGGSTYYKKSELREDGTYVLTTAFTQPVVLAVLVEPTVSPVAQSPASPEGR